MNVHEYILNNWQKTIRTPGIDDSNSFIKLPCTYTTPTESDVFKNFYYWDTYFTNIGLLLDGFDKQAENNISIMAYFVNKLGYVPNADHLIFASQPPFFTRGVWDLYNFKKDGNVIKKYINQVIAELRFWENDRTVEETGLAQYNTNRVESKLQGDYDYFVDRVGGLTESEKKIDYKTMAKNFLAYGESGWDCNMRFNTESNRFASLEFIMLDLNCILYDAETKVYKMLTIIGDSEKAEIYKNKSEKRKSLINQYMLKDDKIYSDYNFKRGTYSSVLSVASLYPYAFGISDDIETCKKVFERLDLQYGISTAEYRGEDLYLQWDYPHMWPTNVYIAYLALKNTGNDCQAELIKQQYMSTVETNFAKTGRLWEKYNAKDGTVSKTIEYETPAMMGWTAAVYEFFYNN